MDTDHEIELHALEMIEQNLNVDRAREQQEAIDGFMVFSASGFMVFSASGFMVF